MGNTNRAFKGLTFLTIRLDASHELCDARGGARTLEAGACVNRHAARVIPAVFKPLQTLHEDGNDIALRNCSDDAAHDELLFNQ
jgi:hypothetical protein